MKTSQYTDKILGGKVPVIYEDSDLLVLDKPSGLVVNRSETAKDLTLEDILVDYLDLPDPDASTDEFAKRAGLAHRLDKGTSGVILVAKNPMVLNFLIKQFKHRMVKKEYLGLVYGALSEPKIEVSAPIARNPRNKMRFAVVAEGREAKTSFDLIEVFQDYSLVRCKPHTGRTHQIRVHLAALNHPLVGDRLYAPSRLYESTQKNFQRLMLHAKRITIIHPGNKEKMSFEAKIPSEFDNLL